MRETAKAAKDMGVRHVMNLGHGIMQVGPGGPPLLTPHVFAGACRRVLEQQEPGLRHRANQELQVLPSAGQVRVYLHHTIACCLPLQGTPEENAAHFFKVAKELRYADL